MPMEIQALLATAPGLRSVLQGKDIASVTMLCRALKRDPNMTLELKILAGERVLPLHVQLRTMANDIARYQMLIDAYMNQLRGIWRWMLGTLNPLQLRAAERTVFSERQSWRLAELLRMPPPEVAGPDVDEEGDIRMMEPLGI